MSNDIRTRLREMLDGPVPFVIGREDIHDAVTEIEQLRDICEQLAHALHCPTSGCPLDWEGIHNWQEYKKDLT